MNANPPPLAPAALLRVIGVDRFFPLMARVQTVAVLGGAVYRQQLWVNRVGAPTLLHWQTDVAEGIAVRFWIICHSAPALGELCSQALLNKGFAFAPPLQHRWTL